MQIGLTTTAAEPEIGAGQIPKQIPWTLASPLIKISADTPRWRQTAMETLAPGTEGRLEARPGPQPHDEAHKGGRGRRHGSRADFLQSGPIRLVLNHAAPPGTYTIDRIVEELRQNGMFPNIDNLLTRVRLDVDLAHARALEDAYHWFLEVPKRQKQTERFFKDLALVSHLIERNKKISPPLTSHHIGVYSKGPRQAPGPIEATRCLMDNLSASNERIKSYLSTFKEKRGKGGNFDPLAKYFIGLVFEAWVSLRSEGRGVLVPEDIEYLLKDHLRVFCRLLAAAWRDTGLPLTDHRGHSRERLEDWFADRIRKSGLR
jgi:hypothetical protein